MKGNSFLLSLLCILALGLWSGCISENSRIAQNQKFQYSGINLEHMDTRIRPGDNFYNYVNGSWLRQTEIPDEEPVYGVWDIAIENVRERVRTLIEDCARGQFKSGDDKQLVGDLYASIVDTNTRNARGLSPLLPDFSVIDRINSYEDLAAYFGIASKYYGWIPLRILIAEDIKDSDHYNVYLTQFGLGLPDREYYLSQDDYNRDLRDKYRQLIEDVFTMLGDENPSEAAKTIYSLELQLAEIQMKKEDTRDYTRLHNIYGTNQLTELMPDFNWRHYLNEAGLGDRDSIVVQMVEYTRSLNDIFINTPLKDWKLYLKWRLADQMRYTLSQEVYTTFFNFYGRELNGMQADKHEWEKAINYVNEYLGQLIVKIYAREFISEEAIQEVAQMVDEVKQAFKLSIEKLEWLSPETKERALEKLSKISVSIVYPKQERNYSGLVIQKDDYYGNARRLLEFYYNYDLSRLDEPVGIDNEWIDLYSGSYKNANNNINIGAVFFQPPFFDEHAEDAANYAGIGSLIGHEMGHAFDDKGSKFDGDGNVTEWWTQKDKDEFQRLSDILVEQFNQYMVLDSLPVNGGYTVGENMADLTGVVIPLKAYKLSLGDKEGPVLDNLTAIQRFFIAYGQSWMEKPREEFLRNQIASDSHAPAHLRVNGIVRNVPEFYTSFNVQESDSLYLSPEARLKIW